MDYNFSKNKKQKQHPASTSTVCLFIIEVDKSDASNRNTVSKSIRARRTQIRSHNRVVGRGSTIIAPNIGPYPQPREAIGYDTLY